MKDYRAYLETLTYIQIDPRLRAHISLSDIIQDKLVEAWHDIDWMKTLDADARKRWLRKMFLNNLYDKIRAVPVKIRKSYSLFDAVKESSSRLAASLAAEDTPPDLAAIKKEEALRLLDALAKLDPRQREALILQKYHNLKLKQIAEHLKCTPGAVAGLHARGLKNLRIILDETGNNHV
jgi:RNA polymerase sigma-70 factor (subfamily 1)